MSFSEPDTSEPSLEQRLIALEKVVCDLNAAHNDIWAQVGVIRADVGKIYQIIQPGSVPHKFAFSPLERLSLVEGALAALSTRLGGVKS
jgi:hypothetical protein